MAAKTVKPKPMSRSGRNGELAQKLQEVTGEKVELAYVDQSYTGEYPAEAAEEQGIRLEVVKLQDAKKGFCASAQALGGGTLICLVSPVPAFGQRL